MSTAPPLITLLTDFGERDHFVASMKGVILSINPAVTIVDLSHQITSHQIEEAGYFLRSCYRYYPDGTIHVAVVDPGVGTARRPLLIATARAMFIGPDNGLFSEVLEQEPGAKMWQIDNKQYRLVTAGSTFDGRDVFAPTAAWLSRGVPPAFMGPAVHDPIRCAASLPIRHDELLIGKVVSIDRFGNLISNITARQVQEFRASLGDDIVEIHVGAHIINDVVGSYSQGSEKSPSALINSGGTLEIFLREESAAHRLQVGVGEEVRLC
ncbi:MAG TPA: SAM-dependent chlorinase/fluorinase [Nitrospira sp.]|nr:SAM-dependent chlorinase/fluorinase [Nitrospira sp.]